MYVDATKNNLRASASMILKSPKRAIFERYLRLNFSATNNEVEHEAFIVGLKLSKKQHILKLHIINDLKLVVNQVIR